MTLCPQLRRLQADHGRWLAGTARRAGETEAGHAARVLALWDAEILPHCRVEEEVLLPELARRLSETDAVVLLTLADHVALRRLVRELRCAGEGQRSASADALERKLTEHAAFEERTLFPAAQETLGCDRLAALAGELTKKSSAVSRRGRRCDGVTRTRRARIRCRAPHP
ncbi:MAG TPA: hemerythrin domain-containing protein [Anaeromyxobacteraceae bacterium]|nr:hemerythrin domain-containing protein [Anaeromyxobacteraceae bacterium]